MLAAASVTNTRALWYLTRGTGVVALVLLTAVVVLGVMNTVRWSSDGWPRFALQRVHRNVSLLAVGFVAAHVLTSVLDTFAPINWLDAVVPFVATYRPVWLGLGAVAFDLLLALAVTSLVRARLGYRSWRFVHWGAYLCWPVALLHGLGTGTDTRLAWMLWFDAAAVASVVVVVWWRVAATARGAGLGRAAIGATVLGAAALAVFTFAGPLAPGWARTAGTPATLLAGTTGTAAAVAATLPSSANFSGTSTRSSPRSGGLVTLRISASVAASTPLTMVLTLRGTLASNGSGLILQAGTVTLASPDGRTRYSGPIAGAEGDQVLARMADAAGHRVDLTATLSIDASGNAQGTIWLRTPSLGGGLGAETQSAEGR